jgi:hypothetical protein
MRDVACSSFYLFTFVRVLAHTLLYRIRRWGNVSVFVILAGVMSAWHIRCLTRWRLRVRCLTCSRSVCMLARSLLYCIRRWGNVSVIVVLVGVVPVWRARRPTRARAGLSITVLAQRWCQCYSLALCWWWCGMFVGGRSCWRAILLGYIVVGAHITTVKYRVSNRFYNA